MKYGERESDNFFICISHPKKLVIHKIIQMNTIRKPMRGWLRALLIIIPFFLFVGISQLLAMLALGLKPSNRDFNPDTFQFAVLELFMLTGTLAVVAIFRKWIDRESFRSLGFGTNSLKQEAFTGLWLGVLMISSGFLILLALGEINWVSTTPEYANLFYSVVLFVAVAFTEELIFRGYILSNLMLSMNRWIALVVTSLFFSAVHMGNAHFTWLSFVSILLAGLLLGLPYMYTKSLWLPVALHFSWNFFQGTIFGFSVSGNSEYALIKQSRPADTMLNGGEFGFEGSLLAVIFLAMAIAGLWLYYSRKERANLSVEELDLT